MDRTATAGVRIQVLEWVSLRFAVDRAVGLAAVLADPVHGRAHSWRREMVRQGVGAAGRPCSHRPQGVLRWATDFGLPCASPQPARHHAYRAEYRSENRASKARNNAEPVSANPPAR
jgi:hypothetical protein